MEMSPLAHEIAARMATAGLGQKALALKAGLNETAVRDILVGKSRHPRHDTVEKLAQALGCTVAELLGGGGAGRAHPAPATDDFVLIGVYDVAAAAGEGIIIDGEYEAGKLAFRADWLRTVTRAREAELAAVTVRGDSMHPTLADGDTILVDLTQRAPLADGIYVVRYGDYVLVKRLLIDPVRRLITIACDNPSYPPLTPVRPDEVDVAGRVIWLGRRVA
ncbi:MAG: XRE family transcriptional regulator [Alphaproteobacteria bacterium]